MDTNTANTASTDTGRKDMFWWIAGGAVAAVLGIGTCVFLFFKKDKKAEKPAEKPAPAPTAQAA